MDEQKNERALSPEEQLDLLLEQFLAEEEPAEVPAPVSEPQPEANALSEDSLWENIDALDPVNVADAEAAAESTESLPEIGPDEQAMASLGLTHMGDISQPELPESAEPDPVSHEDLAKTTAIPAHREEDPLEDEVLRTLLYPQADAFKDDEFRDTFGEGEALEEIFSAAPAEPAPQEPVQQAEVAAEEEVPVPEELPVRKKRPKNKHSYGLLSIPHICATLIWLSLVVAIGATLGRALWLCAADILAFGRPDQTVYITITKSDTLDSVATKLHRAGLVNYPELFKLYGELTDIMDDLSIGTYELNTFYDYHALSSAMSAKPAVRVTKEITIPEGYTCKQIFALLEENEICSAAELEAYASTSLFSDYWFLEGTPRGDKYTLEGFLFPDTYEFYVNSDAKEVYIKLLANFDRRFTDLMQEKLVELNKTLSEKMKKNGFDQAYIDAHQVTIREVVIIASLIEKETSGIEDDRYCISSVIYNRLTNAGKYPYLNIDAALIYVTGDNVLTDEDMKVDSPYNTYLYPGLVPGPIANPGSASLDAALDPLDTKYYYYVLDPESGTHDYSKTFEEHQNKVNKYQKAQGN